MSHDLQILYQNKFPSPILNQIILFKINFIEQQKTDTHLYLLLNVLKMDYIKFTYFSLQFLDLLITTKSLIMYGFNKKIVGKVWNHWTYYIVA